jgi:hypothetical protein
VATAKKNVPIALFKKRGSRPVRSPSVSLIPLRVLLAGRRPRSAGRGKTVRATGVLGLIYPQVRRLQPPDVELRSYLKLMEQIESLRPALRFRVLLGDGAHELEEVTAQRTSE